MPPIQPVGASSKKNILLHADIGTGKTSLIGSGGEEFQIVIMRPPIDHTDPIVGSGCQEMVVRDWNDIWEALDQVEFDKSVTDFLYGQGEDKAFFCLDSISLLQDVGLDDVYEGVLDGKGAKGTAARQHREKFGPDKGEYRVNMWRLGQWVRKAVSAGKFNLIITAHSFWYQPEGADNAYLAPWIQGRAMPERVCGMMNLVGYMEVKTRTVRGQEREARVIHWNKTERYYAKNQFKLPDGTSVFPTGESINPTLPGLVEAINKGKPQVATSTRRRGRPTPAGRRVTNPQRRRGSQ